jgi:branched-chain amino acid aminotransferase
MWDHPHPPYIWLDGELVPWEQATVHVTHGHIFAHAIFEGIRAYWNKDQERLYIFRLDAHLERLYRSIKLMRMETPLTFDEVRRASVEVARANGYREDIYVFPTVYFPPTVYLSRMAGPAHMYINTFPHASALDRKTGVRCAISSWTRITDNMLPARIKCWANYRNSAIAWTEATLSGFDEAVMLNTRGKVCEGPGACLMMIQDGTLITPPVTSDILVSVTRGTILQIGREVLGLPVVEREIDRTELYTAQEAFFCGTGAEVKPIASVDHYPIGNGEIGPITQAFRKAYHDLIRGIDPRYPEWRTLVE